jgi:hypothetical protein
VVTPKGCGKERELLTQMAHAREGQQTCLQIPLIWQVRTSRFDGTAIGVSESPFGVNVTEINGGQTSALRHRR